MHVNRAARAASRPLVSIVGLLLLGLTAASAGPRDRGGNALPRISGTPMTSAVVGQFYYFRPSAYDADGDRLRFKIQGKPAWASFDYASGALSGTPASSDVGTFAGITISVSDGRWGHAWVSLPAFAVAVQAAARAANRPPVIDGAPSTAVVAGNTYSFQPLASDPDGDALAFSIVNKPAWATFSSATGRLSGAPSSSFAGITFGGITISVSDGITTSTLPQFSITVASGNRAPVIGGTPPSSVAPTHAYAFQPSASDPDGDTLTFSITNKPAWANFSSTTGLLSGTPASTQAGTYGGITISVSDGTVSTSLPQFSVTVQAANRAPSISGAPATSATAGQPYSFQPSASDPDGDVLTYSIANRPRWATFSSSTGRLSGTPASGDVATYANIGITVSDGVVSANLPSFSIAVLGATSGSATLSWTPPTTNTDGSPLTDLAGFRVHYGQVSRQYTETLEIPSAGVTSVVIENLVPATWYFSVRAYTAAGTESDLSREAFKTIL